MKKQEEDFRGLMLKVHAKSTRGHLDPTEVVHNWQVIQDSLHGLPEEEEATVFRMFNNMPSLDRSKSLQALARSRQRAAEAVATTDLAETSQRSQGRSVAALPKVGDLIAKRLTRSALGSV